ncbi:MAG: alanine--tRNA ligase [Chloroflexi bacterium]|nr:MAG: alanine--tRNA ligase [Chloroflexota bacterium]
MKQLSTKEIRQLFLDYFHELNHAIVDSSNLVPPDDPTLLFINAGMNQFKDVFLGLEKRDYNRATTSQKCLRVSGKHNDLENVGPSPRHHTFFEMLGNFSFGDYFKKEAIQFAWHLLVNEMGLPTERLWFTVYADDDEAEALWQQVGAAPERVLRFGKKDNWWSMGDVGPCGPCSEIHFYWGDLDKQVPGGVNKDDEYLEIWNLVFMQYEQKVAGGELIPLPKPSVDTGAGLERLASILQGKDNNYDTDAFMPIMARIQELLGHSDAQRQEHLIGYRVIADHSRAMTFLIGDGVLPGNESRNYVLRMVLRRAARFGKRIGFEKPFLAPVCQAVIDEYGDHYTDLPAKQNFILQTVTAEEERFQRTLNTGLARLEELIERLRTEGVTVIPGDEAFRLWGTYGFPVDITRDVAQEQGFSVDEAGFQAARQKDRDDSKASAFAQLPADLSVYGQLLQELQDKASLDENGVRSLIYDSAADVDTKVIGLVVDGASVASASLGQRVEIVLPQTPFYVESGGQVSDSGDIYYFPEDLDEPVWAVRVDDTRRPIAGLIVHMGEVVSGTVQVGDPAYAVIDVERRWDIMRNHTATHILHKELRTRLGDHVHQAGSLVAPDRLRFDFTHTAAISHGELADIERAVNEAILANFVVGDRWTGLEQAKAAGAMALFGEKYGDTVRVVSIGDPEGDDYSKELCGGIHVDSSAEIGSLRITSEGSNAAGVRRIEAVTGRGAAQLIESRMDVLGGVASLLRVRPEEVGEAVEQLREQNRRLQHEIEELRGKLARQESESLLKNAQQINGLAVLAQRVQVEDVDTLRQMSDWFRDKLGSSVVVLGAVIDDKPMLIAAATEDAVKRGIHAGNLVSEAAKIVGGKGGGRPNMAQAGGRDVEKLADALGIVHGWVERNLKG